MKTQIAPEWDVNADESSDVVTPPNLPPITKAELDVDPDDELPKPKAPAASDDDDDDEIELPPDFESAIALVQRLTAEFEAAQSRPVYTKDTLQTKRTNLAKLSHHLKLAKANAHAVQQGDPHVPFPGADYHAAIKTTFAARPQRLAAQLEKLVAFKASNSRPVFPKQRELSDLLALRPFERLLTEDKFRDGVTEFLAHFLDYKISYLQAEVDGLLNPLEALDGLRLRLANSKDLAEIKILKDQIANASAAANGVKHGDDIARVKSVLRNKYQPADSAFVALLVLSKELLSNYLEEAVLAETSFFALYELPHEATSLSNNFAIAIGKINCAISRQTDPASAPCRTWSLPSITHNPIEDTFGLKFEY